MKLLFENWRKFITEDAKFFGKAFEQFKDRTDAGEHPVRVADEVLSRIGQGSTRFAYELPDNPNYVVKTINVQLDPFSDDPNKEFYGADYVHPITGFNRKQKVDSNVWESDLQMQQRYPDVFPRSYEVAEDFSWILVERVQPVDLKKMLEIFNLPEWYDKNDVRAVAKNVIDFMHRKHVSRERNYMTDYLTEDPDTTYAMTPAELEKHKEPPSDVKDIKLVLEDSHNKKLFLAAAELEIPAREFKPSNFGLSTIDGEHLVLLDASLWEEPKGPGEL